MVCFKALYLRIFSKIGDEPADDGSSDASEEEIGALSSNMARGIAGTAIIGWQIGALGIRGRGHVHETIEV